jgi:hypothetical protein
MLRTSFGEQDWKDSAVAVPHGHHGCGRGPRRSSLAGVYRPYDASPNGDLELAGGAVGKEVPIRVGSTAGCARKPSST